VNIVVQKRANVNVAAACGCECVSHGFLYRYWYWWGVVRSVACGAVGGGLCVAYCDLCSGRWGGSHAHGVMCHVMS